MQECGAIDAQTAFAAQRTSSTRNNHYFVLPAQKFGRRLRWPRPFPATPHAKVVSFMCKWPPALSEWPLYYSGVMFPGRNTLSEWVGGFFRPSDGGQSLETSEELRDRGYEEYRHAQSTHSDLVCWNVLNLQNHSSVGRNRCPLQPIHVQATHEHDRM